MTPFNGLGRCICDAVQYQLTAPPMRTTICYCRYCQRNTGTAQMILPVLEQANFGFIQGEPSTFTHISEGSGKQLHQHFCQDCSTKLAVTFERFPGMIGLYAGTLDDPSIVPLDSDHAKQIFVSVARPGTVIWAGVPTYWEHAVTLDGKPEKSIFLDRPLPVEEVRFD